MKRILIAFLCMFSASAFATGLLTPNIQGQDQNQGQAQGQLQGQGQAQMTNVSNRISNEIRNNALSFAGAASGSTSTSASGGNTLVVNEAPIPANTTQSIHQDSYTIKGVPNVFSGNVYPTSPCMGSSTVGGAGVGFGFSVGSSWTDDECGIRETARSFAGMGMKEDSLAILCTSKYAAAAPSCPKPVAKE
jgi:hypothetical protein